MGRSEGGFVGILAFAGKRKNGWRLLKVRFEWNVWVLAMVLWSFVVLCCGSLGQGKEK